eukprot:scaffold7302_cov72-Cyclotella_meneghiniana.AAC.7
MVHVTKLWESKVTAYAVDKVQSTVVELQLQLAVDSRQRPVPCACRPARSQSASCQVPSTTMTQIKGAYCTLTRTNLTLK